MDKVSANSLGLTPYTNPPNAKLDSNSSFSSSDESESQVQAEYGEARNVSSDSSGYSSNTSKKKEDIKRNKPVNEIQDADFYFGGTPSQHVFIYDHHTKKTLEKLLGHDIAVVGSDIKGYHRYFGSNICSIMARDGVKCRGFMFLAEETELPILEKEYEGFKKIKVDIYDEHGNDIKGITFIKSNIKWGVPSIDYLKKVYVTVKQGWGDVDNKNNLYVYNNDYHLMGVYDGTKYIDESVNTDITKISLTHPSPFLKRLQDREPTLFIKEESQAFSQYSKICPANRKRYPVILTKSEKERVDKEAPGSYSSVVEYGTDPKKQFYYICPRYWNLKTNMPMNPEDVDPSKIIDEKTKEADLTKKYIFEFLCSPKY
jgi:hypothetical protein